MTVTATAKDPQQCIDEAIGKISSISTLPEVTSRIISTVEDPKSTASQLHKIVSHDPALVTRILKVVNSAFYGLPGQIGSIDRAIVLMGLNAVKNIAVAASLGQMFRGAKLCDGISARDLWTHCIAVSVASRDLCRQLKAPIADEAFLAGMIHDVGILVALQVWPEKLKQVCTKARQTGENFIEVEREINGADHQQLGSALAARWKFPQSCQFVAGYHHHPSTLHDDDHRLLVTIVHAADVLCGAMPGGFNLTVAGQAMDESATQWAGITAEMLTEVRQSLPRSMEAASALLA